jgi:hypothetical protein
VNKNKFSFKKSNFSHKKLPNSSRTLKPQKSPKTIKKLLQNLLKNIAKSHSLKTPDWKKLIHKIIGHFWQTKRAPKISKTQQIPINLSTFKQRKKIGKSLKIRGAF